MAKHHHEQRPEARRIAALLDKVRQCSAHDIIEKIEELFDRREHGEHHRAHRLRFSFTWCGLTFKGENMTFTMPPFNPAGIPSKVPAIGSPVQADGTTPSEATLSAAAYTSSDPTIFTVAPDPKTPNGAIITAVAAPAAGLTVSATLQETAIATEADGTTTETISGVATIVIAAPAPATPPAAALVFTFGTPQ
jgi:hypothetical protein